MPRVVQSHCCDCHGSWPHDSCLLSMLLRGSTDGVQAHTGAAAQHQPRVCAWHCRWSAVALWPPACPVHLSASRIWALCDLAWAEGCALQQAEQLSSSGGQGSWGRCRERLITFAGVWHAEMTGGLELRGLLSAMLPPYLVACYLQCIVRLSLGRTAQRWQRTLATSSVCLLFCMMCQTYTDLLGFLENLTCTYHLTLNSKVRHSECHAVASP